MSSNETIKISKFVIKYTDSEGNETYRNASFDIPEEVLEQYVLSWQTFDSALEITNF